MDVDSWIIERTKETKPLDVIHVEMGQENVNSSNLFRKLQAETPDSRTGVQHQEGAIFRSHFDRRGISSITRRLGSWRRDRAAGPKQGNAHQSESSQNMAAAPRNSP